VAAREGTADHEGKGGGPFRSLFDFCARVDRQRVNKRVVEALIKAGAFDALHPDRASALASVSLAFEWADAQEANALQGGLFDFGDERTARRRRSPPWPTPSPGFARAADAGEGRAGLLPVGHLFDESMARRCGASCAAHRRPDRFARAGVLAGIVAGCAW
jgi:DNA polymerase III subunit alpha